MGLLGYVPAKSLAQNWVVLMGPSGPGMWPHWHMATLFLSSLYPILPLPPLSLSSCIGWIWPAWEQFSRDPWQHSRIDKGRYNSLSRAITPLAGTDVPYSSAGLVQVACIGPKATWDCTLIDLCPIVHYVIWVQNPIQSPLIIWGWGAFLEPPWISKSVDA